MNAYNRKNVVQQAIKYEPLTVTFHDDSSDVIRNFWFDYYSHYYRDSDYSQPTYVAPYKYYGMTNVNSKSLWGYQPANYDKSASNSERLINRIKIYSLYRKRFTEYILINPVITNFSHGQHQQGSNEFLENTMTIAYESVLYNYGTTKVGGEPSGFATLNYDKTPSPLSPQGGGTNSIFGPGGAASAVQGVSNSLSDGNYLGAGLTAAKSINNFKNANWGTMAKTELSSIGMGILSGDTNTLNRLSLFQSGPAAGQLGSSQPPTVQD
jgi:hypothetical protein